MSQSLALQSPSPAAQERIKHIIEASVTVLASQGYANTSIKDIARASQINSALIYYYFTNKEHLFVEALRYSASTAAMHQQQSRFRRRRLRETGRERN